MESCGRRQSRLGSKKNPPEIIKPPLSFVDKRNQRKVNLFKKQTSKFDRTWSALFKQIQPIKENEMIRTKLSISDKNINICIGPRSGHSLPMSVTDSLTN